MTNLATIWVLSIIWLTIAVTCLTVFIQSRVEARKMEQRLAHLVAKRRAMFPDEVGLDD